MVRSEREDEDTSLQLTKKQGHVKGIWTLLPAPQLTKGVNSEFRRHSGCHGLGSGVLEASRFWSVPLHSYSSNQQLEKRESGPRTAGVDAY
jgi:hypothetical protein